MSRHRCRSALQNLLFPKGFDYTFTPPLAGASRMISIQSYLSHPDSIGNQSIQEIPYGIPLGITLALRRNKEQLGFTDLS